MGKFGNGDFGLKVHDDVAVFPLKVNDSAQQLRSDIGKGLGSEIAATKLSSHLFLVLLSGGGLFFILLSVWIGQKLKNGTSTLYSYDKLNAEILHKQENEIPLLKEEKQEPPILPRIKLLLQSSEEDQQESSNESVPRKKPPEVFVDANKLVPFFMDDAAKKKKVYLNVKGDKVCRITSDVRARLKPEFESFVQSIKFYTDLPLIFYKKLMTALRSRTVKLPAMGCAGKMNKLSDYVASLVSDSKSEFSLDNWNDLGWQSRDAYDNWLQLPVAVAFVGCGHFCTVPRLFDYSGIAKSGKCKGMYVFKQVGVDDVKMINIFSVAGFDLMGVESVPVSANITSGCFRRYSQLIMSQILAAAKDTGMTDVVMVPVGMGVFLSHAKDKMREEILLGFIAGLNAYTGPPLNIHCCLIPGHFARLGGGVKNNLIRLIDQTGKDAYTVVNAINDAAAESLALANKAANEAAEALRAAKEEFDKLFAAEDGAELAAPEVLGAAEQKVRQASLSMKEARLNVKNVKKNMRQAMIVNAADHDWVANLNPQREPGQLWESDDVYTSTLDEYLGNMTRLPECGIGNFIGPEKSGELPVVSHTELSPTLPLVTVASMKK